MKAPCLLMALVPALAGAEVAEPYVNFVRQIQADRGVEWDVTVAAEGAMLSTEGVGPDGSHFQLWSVHALTTTDFLLDEGFVSAYSPRARITIQTGDPYALVPRTRCDQPFRVSVGVSGLITNPNGHPDIPVAASRVHLGHEVFHYPVGEHSFDRVPEPLGIEMSSGYISQNGDLHLDYAATNLTGPDLTALEGEEVFTVSSLADYGFTEAVLDAVRVQIWPIADAEVRGLDPAMQYTDVPPVTISLTDLYPDSTTWVRIYPGPPSTEAHPEGVKIVLTSYLRIEDRIPQNRILLLDELSEYFRGGEEFTVDVLHETPFGIDILAQAPVRLKSSLAVRAWLFSQAEQEFSVSRAVPTVGGAAHERRRRGDAGAFFEGNGHKGTKIE